MDPDAGWHCVLNRIGLEQRREAAWLHRQVMLHEDDKERWAVTLSCMVCIPVDKAEALATLMNRHQNCLRRVA